jgi:hypothetical protein
MTYPERFVAVGADQASRPGTSVQPQYETWLMGPPRATLTPSKLLKATRTAMHELGLAHVPEDLRTLYAQHDYLTCAWQLHDPAYGPALVRGYECLLRADAIFKPTAYDWVVEAGD